MKIDMICKILMIVGALNWGLVGLFNMDIVAMLFGSMTVLSRLIYIVVGVAGVMALVQWKNICPCKKK